MFDHLKHPVEISNKIMPVIAQSLKDQTGNKLERAIAMLPNQTIYICG